MKNLLLFLLVLLIPFYAYPDQSVIGTLYNVDLISKDRLDKNGEKHGVDYYIHNRNQFPIYASIEAVTMQNVYDNLPASQYIIDEGENAHIGWIVQTDESQDSKWEVSWNIEME